MDEEFNDIESVVSETDSETEKQKIPIDIKNTKVIFNDDDDDYVESDNDENEDLESESSDIIEDTNEILDTNRPFGEFNNFSDDEDDDSDDDENYLQKFDADIKQKIISEFHPELQAHNYDEIEILSRIVRDDNGNIIDPLHKTLPFITKYEKARIIGERAKQIDSGAEPMVEIEPNMIDGYLIALKEYEAKAIPFIIQRPIPSGASEYWKFSDLEIL
uniref:DNA-directed RNA polymerase n=1 Tax=viral metagenome TaxID=1070528 RepID=A0A6C0DBP0_9ZZZZ